MCEEWRAIQGEEGRYEVSSLGRVKSLDREVVQSNSAGTYTRIMKGRLLKPQNNPKGYHFVWIGRKQKLVHRLVAEAFVDNPTNFPQVNHEDGCKTNNEASNLTWTDNSGNQQHAIRTGLMQKALGEAYPHAVLTEELVRELRSIHIKGHPEYGSKGLSKKYGVHAETIRNAVVGRTWKHVK